MSNPRQHERAEPEHLEQSRGRFGTALGLVGVALLALGIAFTALGTPASPEPPRATASEPPVAAALDVQRVHLPTGAVYVMTLGLMADEPTSLVFASGQHYDFIVRQGDRELWRSSASRAFHQAFNELRLEPGALTTFVKVWNGTAMDGALVSGDVEVEAWITSTEPIRTTPFSLYVEGADEPAP